jgi:hypothetical protein
MCLVQSRAPALGLWAGLGCVAGSQSLPRGILLDKSVTISENEHQVGCSTEGELQCHVGDVVQDEYRLCGGFGGVLGQEKLLEWLCESQGYDKMDDARQTTAVHHFGVPGHVNTHRPS